MSADATAPRPEVVAARQGRLAGEIVAMELDAVLVSDLINVRYLTGFTGSSGVVLVSADGRCWLATDSRYQIQAGSQSPGSALLVTRQGAVDLLALAASEGWQRVGFEDSHMSVAEHSRLVGASTVELVSAGAVVCGLREQKDSFELDMLRSACASTTSALETVLPHICVGTTELQVARLLDDAMRDSGTEGPGFSTIVASGPNSAIPHHEPTARVIAPGDFVKMDFGARVGGYHADMTRTVIMGEPEDWQAEVYALVAGAQAAGRDALGVGVAASEVDRVARDVIANAGYGEQFGHGLGHGVGLQIHEAPSLGATSTDTLTATVPVTVEPGVYLPGRGGVRIEDTVVVHQDRVEILTTFPRELLVLDA